jgi:predicted nuclease of predicted toxin-antitoxin system
VKLLFDQNLSHRLVTALQQEYPGSQHVRDVGLKDAADIAIWECAAQQRCSKRDCVAVTKR